MLREEVAGHYRERGYTIREHAQVRGRSGAVHTVDMVAQGPLGNLIIALEDAGGFEGPEMNAVRTAARDIGATPVMAARRIPEGLRRRASEAGVVLLDASDLGAPPEPEPVFEAPEDDPYPPWPDPERSRTTPSAEEEEPPRPSKSTDPGFWRYPRGGAQETVRDEEPAQDEAEPAKTTGQTEAPASNGGGFQWLPQETEASPTAPQAVVHAPMRRPPVEEPPPATAPAWNRWLLLAVAAGASAGAAFYLLGVLLG